MTVYSSKTQTVRSVAIEPSETWGGQGLLGVSIRFCSFEGANESIWHVLEVHPSSPAELAGLRSFNDYIIGADSVLHENEDLFALIEAHEGRSLKLYVYNSLDDCCREVMITPHRGWGGEGSLGCGIGYGYLHRIPVRGMTPISKPNLMQAHLHDLKTDSLYSNPISTADASSIINSTYPQPFVASAQFSNPIQSYATTPIQANAITPNSFTDLSSISSNSTNVPLTTSTNFTNCVAVSNIVTPTTYALNSATNYFSTSVPLGATQFTPTSNNVFGTTETTPLLLHQSIAPPVTNTQFNLSSAPTGVFQHTTPIVTSIPSHFQYTSSLNSQTTTNVSHSNSAYTPQLIFDPTIAAQSAQQLLLNTNTTLS